MQLSNEFELPTYDNSRDLHINVEELFEIKLKIKTALHFISCYGLQTDSSCISTTLHKIHCYRSCGLGYSISLLGNNSLI